MMKVGTKGRQSRCDFKSSLTDFFGNILQCYHLFDVMFFYPPDEWILVQYSLPFSLCFGL